MKRFWFSLFLTVFAGFTFSQTPTPEPEPAQTLEVVHQGVVVDEIAKNSVAEKAGLREGDILLSWVRDDATGKIESPFHVMMLTLNEAPRGAIVLKGWRGSEAQVWTLGPGIWGLKTRPHLTQSVLSNYLEGRELARAGKWVEGARHWQVAVSQVDSPTSTCLWLLYQAAFGFSRERQWKEVDENLQLALDRAGEAEPLIRGLLYRGWASSYKERGDWANAEKYHEQSLAENEKLSSESLLIAADHNDLGVIARLRGDLDKAEKHHRKALEIRQKLAPNSLDVAASFNNLGNVAWQHGDLAKAEHYLLQALEIKRTLAPESLDVAISLNSLGNVARDQTNLENAERYLHEALEIEQKLAPGSSNVAASLDNLGVVVWQRGDLVQADQYFQQAFELKQKLSPESLDVATSLNNLGNVAWQRGDLANAEQYFQAALTIGQKLVPVSLEVANALNNLAAVADERGDLTSAEQYFHRALDIRQKLAPGSLDVASNLDNLGKTALQRGDLAKAEEYHLQALTIGQKLAPGSINVAATFDSLGKVAAKKGDLEKAEYYRRQAVDIRQKIAPQRREYAGSLAALALILRHKGQLDDAAKLYRQALDVLEGQLTLFGGAEEIRSDFRSKHRAIYWDYIGVLLKQNKPELAFQFLERSRARGMLEMLVETHVNIRKGVDPLLVQQERSLRESIRAKSEHRIRNRDEKPTGEKRTGIDPEINKLLAQYEEIEGRIRSTSPTYADLTQPQSLDVQQVQHLLDADTLLLEYSLGDEQSDVFVVSSTSLVVYELPDRTKIQAAAERVHNLFVGWDSNCVGAPRAKLQNCRATLEKTLSDLSQMILGPIAEQIKGKRLLIVSDGALEYVPFGALPSPRVASSEQPANHRVAVPLIVEHEIVNLPSPSVLAEVRRQMMVRHEAPKAVVVLADPVFDKTDERVRPAKMRRHNQITPSRLATPAAAMTPPRPAEPLARLISDVGLPVRRGQPYLPRLPFTRREAQRILAVTPAGQGIAALDFDANRATMLSPELAQYRIVHIATHGFVDNANPDLSGIVLSLVDEHGKQQDGFLGLQEIYNLELNADLVVLSACQTGLGKQIEGEGLLGMTRGFMYAGASRVVASLWNADDPATAELMARFYKAMEKDQMPPAAALRQAQVQMWKQKRWKDAYYWASFQIQGEWK